MTRDQPDPDLPVQVAFTDDEAIMFGRDQTGEPTVIVWTREEFRELIEAAKRGEFDPPEEREGEGR